MDQTDLKTLLKRIASGTTSVTDGVEQLKHLPFRDMGYAKVDHHRSIRTGRPEVIFCQGKTVEQVVGIARAQREHGESVLGTRASPETLAAVATEFPKAVVNELGRCFFVGKSTTRKLKQSRIVIAAAGTADLPVAEEARCTVEAMGHKPTVMYDVGVAGIHRLFAHRETLTKASVVIVIAGMEGALPSVVAGLVSCPVIGVPTSVGYGSHLNGLVPLFAMLNSCATGLTVVNIDNGFGAAAAAVLMVQNRRSAR
jgi:pyridinium-3,5-biscarboxylic acid mononucleotide synthase